MRRSSPHAPAGFSCRACGTTSGWSVPSAGPAGSPSLPSTKKLVQGTCGPASHKRLQVAPFPGLVAPCCGLSGGSREPTCTYGSPGRLDWTRRTPHVRTTSNAAAGARCGCTQAAAAVAWAKGIAQWLLAACVSLEPGGLAAWRQAALDRTPDCGWRKDGRGGTTHKPGRCSPSLGLPGNAMLR